MGLLEGGALAGVAAFVAFLVKRTLAAIYRRWEEERLAEEAAATEIAEAEAQSHLSHDDLVKRLRDGGF